MQEGSNNLVENTVTFLQCVQGYQPGRLLVAVFRVAVFLIFSRKGGSEPIFFGDQLGPSNGRVNEPVVRRGVLGPQNSHF